MGRAFYFRKPHGSFLYRLRILGLWVVGHSSYHLVYLSWELVSSLLEPFSEFQKWR
jgi:hypothetical protein